MYKVINKKININLKCYSEIVYLLNSKFTTKMNIETIRESCLSKKDATESFPFGEDTLVFKVNNKIFALVNLDGELSLNLKCDPAIALELRERYSSVTGAYHMNKKHWNSIYIDGSVPDKEIFGWIDHSYNLVIRKK